MNTENAAIQAAKLEANQYKDRREQAKEDYLQKRTRIFVNETDFEKSEHDVYAEGEYNFK